MTTTLTTGPALPGPVAVLAFVVLVVIVTATALGHIANPPRRNRKDRR